MEKVAIVIETQNGKIKPSNFGVVTAAHGEDHETYAFVMDGRAAEHKAAIQSYGVHHIVEIASNDGPFPWNPAVWSDAIIEAMQHFGINSLFGLTSAQGKDLLPRIAAQLDAPLIMDCTGVNLAEHIAEKSQYSGRTIASIKTHGVYHI